MSASAWFLIAVFALFGLAMLGAILMGAHRDKQVEQDVRREARRRLGLRHGRGRRSPR